jgi:phosphate transport system permease protein
VTGGGFTSLIILGLIALFLLLEGLPIFQEQGIRFVTGFEWESGDPENGIPARYGIGAMLIGTLVVSFIGLVIALPLAVGTALFLTYYAPERLKRGLTIVVDLMASIPSVIYGLWGFIFLMPYAIYWAKIDTVYYGNTKDDAANIGFDDSFIYDEMKKPVSERVVQMKQISCDYVHIAFEEWVEKVDKIKY